MVKGARVCKECGKTISESRRSNAIFCCKRCGERFHSKRYYTQNPELFRKKRLKDNSNVEKRILSRVKSRAKRLGIPFGLELSDIIIPELCPVLSIPIWSAPGQGRNPINSPSLDRVNPELGYIKGNIRVISNRANLLKSNATLEELEMILKDALSLRND